MSGAAANYAYLHSRVSVMAEQILSTEQMATLIECDEDERNAILRHAGLEALELENIDDPAVLKQRLVDVLLVDFLVLSRALTGIPREFLIYWARRYELGNLKAIFRGKMTNQTEETIRGSLVDIGTFATLPMDDLMRTEDVGELIRLLESTPYTDIARQARRVYEEKNELFALDAALDRRFLAGLNQRVNGLEASDRRLLRTLVGAIYDRFNLIWLLRYRFAYMLTPAETYYLLVPGGYQISSEQLQALVQHGSFEEVLANLPPLLAKEMEMASCTSTVDRILELHIANISESILRRTTFNLARAFAYLVLREKDLLQLHAIFTGQRLQINSDTIRLALWSPITALQIADDLKSASIG